MGTVDSTQTEIRSRVLQKLRENGRASFSQIATQLEVPRNQVAGIIQEALDQGEFRVTVSLSPDLLGIERFAYLQLDVASQLDHVRAALIDMPETTFVADITGPRAVDAEIRVGPDPHLRETINFIKSLEGVRRVHTHLYESIQINEHSPIRTGSTPFRIDRADRDIIRVLQQNGRATFQDMAEAARISPSGARLKLQRLIVSGAVKIVGIHARSKRHTTQSIGVGIRIRGDVNQALSKVSALGPEFLAIALGEFDFIATFASDTSDRLLELCDCLRALPCVESLDTWANIRMLKEQYGEGDQLITTDRIVQASDR